MIAELYRLFNKVEVELVEDLTNNEVQTLSLLLRRVITNAER